MNAVRAIAPPMRSIAERVRALDWQRIVAELDANGAALTGPLLDAGECEALRASYASDEKFRNRVVMQRHGFGRGEYRYFAYPLPAMVAALRATLYVPLAELANRWHDALGIARRFPPSHEKFLAQCRRGGQSRPTPLLLRYGVDDYNCLHQDVYGEHVFPLQATILLSEPGQRLYRRRVRTDRAAPTPAIARRSRSVASRRGGDIRSAASADARRARKLSCQSASRRESPAIRRAFQLRRDLPRRRLAAG